MAKAAKKAASAKKDETIPEKIAAAIGTAAGTIVKKYNELVHPGSGKPAKKTPPAKTPARKTAAKKTVKKAAAKKTATTKTAKNK